MNHFRQRPTSPRHRPPRWLGVFASGLVLWGLFLSPLCAYLCAAAERSPQPKPSCHQEEASGHEGQTNAPCGSSLCERLQPLSAAETYAGIAAAGTDSPLIAMLAEIDDHSRKHNRPERYSESPPGSFGPSIPLPLHQVLRT